MTRKSFAGLPTPAYSRPFLSKAGFLVKYTANDSFSGVVREMRMLQGATLRLRSFCRGTPTSMDK